ncbi:MAG: hypothetical protein ABIW85_00420 [Variovorax sp.]
MILGEYAVLAGGAAIVAAMAPRFGAVPLEGKPGWHASSPAGKLERWATAKGLDVPAFRLNDPWNGAGGFGGSTAEFVLLYHALAEQTKWSLSAVGAHRMYRELTAGDPVPPSGADLVAQWSGGVVRFDPVPGSIEPRGAVFDWRKLLVFSATHQPGRKVATHEHLAVLADHGFDGSAEPPLVAVLRAILADFDQALSLSNTDDQVVGAALTRYAQVLSKAGFESPEASEDRRALCEIPGVLGAKGCGAMLTDAVIVLATDAPARADAVRLATARGLRLVNGLNGLNGPRGLNGSEKGINA